MDMSDSIPMLLSSVALFFSLLLCISINVRRSRKSPKTPPGPFKLPIIGNLHQIAINNPHQSLAKLSKNYGPIMSVKLGSRETVVVSNRGFIQQILQKNDLVCSSRRVPHAAHALDHHKFSMVWLPVSGPWKSIRKLCREHMFSQQRLDANQELRQEKLRELVDYVKRCSKHQVAVDIGSAAFITVMNSISRTMLSIDFAEYDANSSAQELMDAVWSVMSKLALPNLSDFFPALRWMDPQGIMRGTKSYFEKLFDIFDGIIKERLLDRENGNGVHPKNNDLLEAVLDGISENDEFEFNIDMFKHILMDLLLAGIDTTSNTIEWGMAELLRNPKIMEKAKAELKKIIGEKDHIIQESDISKLPYLQAVVKETFRLHPPGPLLVPHRADEDVEIDGYIVRKDTDIMINVWASGRDEGTWTTQPEMFVPERFLESEIDVKGSHFELLPFGSGRRICPGLHMGYRMVHLTMASLIHNIDWKIEGGIKPEDLNMDEKFRMTIQKAIPLKAIPEVKWQLP